MSDCLQAPETRDWAATLLAGTPGKAADQALAQALAGADLALSCTLLGAAAIRKNVDLILPSLADKDTAVATADLGRIGTEDALAALSKPAAPALEEVRMAALAAGFGTPRRGRQLPGRGASRDAGLRRPRRLGPARPHAARPVGAGVSGRETSETRETPKAGEIENLRPLGSLKSRPVISRARRSL
ncbi:MAG TPA: hypothetical protein PKM57_15475 [Kiritimatiellia bacterium]|nr:hypothetical protein [Kiritimatiellia bacterium]